MIYTDTIKSGFSLINKRWQLVAVQAGTMAINCVGFFIFVGIPLGIAFIIFGLDLTSLASAKDFLSIFRHPAELFSKYLGLIIVVLTFFFLYIAIASTLSLFVFGGAVGMIGRSLLDPALKFSMGEFFREARKLFFPLMWFSVVMGLIFVAIAFLIGLLGGGIAVMVSFARGQDSTLALFLGTFFSLVLVLSGLSVLLGGLAVTVYGFAVLYFRGNGVFSSLSEAVRFVWDNQRAFFLYIVLFASYFVISFFLMLIVYPLKIVPFVGPVLSFPLQILSYVVQSYLGMVVIATSMIYYFREEVEQPTPLTGAVTEGSAAGSSGAEDTSLPQAPAHDQAPSGKDSSDQA